MAKGDSVKASNHPASLGVATPMHKNHTNNKENRPRTLGFFANSTEHFFRLTWNHRMALAKYSSILMLLKL